MIHILGGMVLFMTDGIVVSEECGYVIKIRISQTTFGQRIYEGTPRSVFALYATKSGARQ